jgi:hypothetical protein
MTEPLTEYLGKIREMRSAARNPLAIRHLDELLHFYETANWVETQNDKGVAVDFFEPRQSTAGGGSANPPTPPPFISESGPQMLKPPKAEAKLIARVRPPLDRIERDLLGNRPDDYFAKAPGGGVLPPQP